MARTIEWHWEYDKDDRTSNYMVTTEPNEIRRHEIMAEAEERVRERDSKFAVIHEVIFEEDGPAYYELGVARRFRFGRDQRGVLGWTLEIVAEFPPDVPRSTGAGVSRFDREPLI